MLIILAVLLIIARRKYKETGTTGTLIILYSFILSTFLGVVYKILFPNQVGQYSIFSMLYYLICLILFFVPLLKNNIGWESFYFPEKSTRIISIILIIGGFVVLYSSIVNFDMNRLNMSLLEQRNEYYQNYHEDAVIATRWYDRISSNIRHLMILSIPLFYYYLCKNEKKYAVLLGSASLSLLAMSIMNASRQEFILWVGCTLYSYFLFRSGLNEKTKHGVKLFLWIFGGLSIAAVVAITLSRFGAGTGYNTWNVFFQYSGAQPYNAARFLEELHSQAQWGKINFPYLWGSGYVKEINDYIESPFYLNVFGSLVGSFYLDFGYFTVFFVFIYSLLFDKLLSFYKRKNSFAYFFLYNIYCDIIFSGMFYYRYITSERIRILVFVLFLIIIIDNSYSKKKV